MLLWIGALPLIYMVANFLRLKWSSDVPHWFHRGMCFIFGLRVSFSGAQHSEPPILFVSNHISYLDIFAMGSIRAYFIAKSEVASWPVLGAYARFQNTLFFERSAGRARQQLTTMQAHLRGGKSLILFAEGTSTQGVHVEPFKSSLFEAANLAIGDMQSGPAVPIQPITIAYTHQAGRKMDQSVRDNYAWYAKMKFGSHALGLFSLCTVDVKIHFHPVCYLADFDNRKQCADFCQAQVAAKLAELLQ